MKPFKISELVLLFLRERYVENRVTPFVHIDVLTHWIQQLWLKYPTILRQGTHIDACSVNAAISGMTVRSKREWVQDLARKEWKDRRWGLTPMGAARARQIIDERSL